MFFCEEPERKKNGLIRAATDIININVNSWVAELGDRKLMTKLAEGDMHAIDAMYHKNCYSNLRNRFRSLKRNENHKNQPISHYESIAFAELVAYIEEACQITDTIPTFQLNTLTKLYETRLAELKQIDVKEINKHSGRLKDRLLKHFPGLQAQPKGKNLLLIFSKDIGSTIQHAISRDMDEDKVILAKAAQIVRKEMFSKEYEFTGSFESNCERNAVSKSLLALTRMILEGPSIKNQSNCNTKREQISVTLTELLQFNETKKSYSEHGIRNKKSKTPLPIYLSMLMRTKIRRRSLIDTL